MKKINKLFWGFLGILWIPFEILYIIYSVKEDGSFSVSKIGDFLINKDYDKNK